MLFQISEIKLIVSLENNYGMKHKNLDEKKSSEEEKQHTRKRGKKKKTSHHIQLGDNLLKHLGRFINFSGHVLRYQRFWQPESSVHPFSFLAPPLTSPILQQLFCIGDPKPVQATFLPPILIKRLLS